MARVTVCLSVYNGADTIADCLKSVFAQTYRDFDVLVLDDGSTDGSADIAEEFDCRVIRIPNGGRGAALKRMIEEAEGELIALIDRDDYWLPEKLQKQIGVFDATGATLVHADCWYVHPDGREIERNLSFKPDATAFDHLLPTNVIIASSAVFNRQRMLDVGNFTPQTLRCCDWYGWFLLARDGKFVHVPEKLVRYSVLDTSLANAGLKFFDSQYQLLSNMMLPRAEDLFANLDPAQAAKFKKMMVVRSGIALSSMGRALEKAGDKRAARDLHKRAIKMAPNVFRVWSRAIRSLL